MNVETLRDHCLSKPHVDESFPFGPDTLVFKVMDKIFLLTGLDQADSFNAKCDPEKAVALREQYPEIQPGYHMNKTHWNTVSMTGRLTDGQLKDLVDYSYELVVKSLPKSKQALMK